MLAEVTEMMNGLPKPSHHDTGISHPPKPHPCLQTPNAPHLLEGDFLRDKADTHPQRMAAVHRDYRSPKQHHRLDADFRLVWWYVPAIPSPGRLRLGHYEFKAYLGCPGTRQLDVTFCQIGIF